MLQSASAGAAPLVCAFVRFKASAQLEAIIRAPSIDFVFKTDPLETSECDFAVMGGEVNGRYYT
jgi:hypothetical protein